ncbi:protein obstructor-E-like [Brevipalpus obovatus]|uniref:protein obstructor-E-like n=1 Tax=Brevipalpus obovatus TaxID=246614 RepID=UPI003D9E01B9
MKSILIITFLVFTTLEGILAQRSGPQFAFPSSQPQSDSSEPNQPASFDNYQPPARPNAQPVDLPPTRREPPKNLPPPNRYEPPPQTSNKPPKSVRQSSSPAQTVTIARDYDCPERSGFFPHPKSCDKYYACENSTAVLKVCGNGLVFDDSDSLRENCAYPFSVDCGDRTDLEPPISTPNCPRLYGIFPHSSDCKVFYSCWNGDANKYECPPGLAYDDQQRVCVWADLVERCDQLELAEGFVCPDPSEVDQPGHYTRHAHPTDCRKFYVCIENVARPYGCSFGTVFNVDTLQCDDPENVPGCEKYYGDVDPKTAKKLKGSN